MLINRLFLVLIVLLFLAGCSGLPAAPTASDATSGGVATDPVTSDSLPADPPVSSATSPAEEPRPPQINLPVVGVGEPYPAPSNEEVGSGVVAPTEQPAEEQAGSGMLTPAEISITNISVRVEGEDPAQVFLVITGNLPTPCHQFAYTLGQPDAEGNLNVEVYSLVDPNAGCAQALQPFEETIDLGSFPAGSYTIWVNGEVVQQLGG